MQQLDFEGDYGRDYKRDIRRFIPAYDAILELGTATLRALASESNQALVVGPGAGEELAGIVQALPHAHITMIEPSPQMRSFCERALKDCGAAQRTAWGPNALSDVANQFDVVICHHVIHLMPAAEQRLFLEQLCAKVAVGGLLLLSSYSENSNGDSTVWQAIARDRFLLQGMDQQAIDQVMALRNVAVHSLSPDHLEQQLVLAGLEPPTQLLQALFNRLWFSRRLA